jgi:hypothetical protein
LAGGSHASPDEAAETLKSAGVKADDGFEIAFNMACAAIAAGNLPAAQKFLDLADRRGQEVLLEEDASQDVRSHTTVASATSCAQPTAMVSQLPPIQLMAAVRDGPQHSLT